MAARWDLMKSLQDIVDRADTLLAALDNAPTTAVLDDAANQLKELRDWRQFDRLIGLAEAISQHRPGDLGVRKIYAQGLLDTGRPSLARDVLELILHRAGPDDTVAIDAEGLLGRAHKDMLAAAHDDVRALEAARAAFRHYLGPFRATHLRSTYHGINAVAVLHLAHTRKLALAPGLTPADLADEVLAVLDAEKGDAPSAWWYATAAEAHIARGDYTAAAGPLLAYIGHEDTNLFALGSTARQFREIWRLQDQGPTGAALLQMLEAQYLSAAQGTGSEDGAALEMPAAQIRDMREQGDVSQDQLQRVLGDQGTQTLAWYRMGLARAGSVGSVRDEVDEAVGTCFVVDPGDFGVTLDAGEILILTNHHVVNEDGAGTALRPAEVRIRFEAADGDAADTLLGPVQVLSEANSLTAQDYALLRLNAKGLTIPPVPINDELPARDSKARVYVIGYPLGKGLQFSLQDNLLLDHEGPPNGDPKRPARRLVQYFAPTDPGSSGSPVFDEKWRCIALHHAGDKRDPKNGHYGMSKLNGQKGKHSANQGIWIKSVIDHARIEMGATTGGESQ